MKTLEDKPAVYVGTYAKYNSGNLFGDWIYPEDYFDKEEFMEACKELHKDERDPELMFQDWQNFDIDFCTECSISDDFWEWIDFEEYEKEIFLAWVDAFGNYSVGDSLRNAMDDAMDAYAFSGENELIELERYLEDTEALSEVSDSLREYIDFSAYLENNFTTSYRNGTDYAFRN